MVKRFIWPAGCKINEVLRKMTLLRRTLKMLWHVIGVGITYRVAFLLRFDGLIPLEFQHIFWHSLPVLLVICLLSFLAFRVFSDVWSYFSVDDLVRLTTSVAVAIGVFAVMIYALPGQDAFVPRSVTVLEFILLNLWLSGGRLGARYMRRFRGGAGDQGLPGQERLLLVGTLEEADLMIRESQRKGLGRVVGVVGDDAGNQNILLHGIQVFHRRPSEIAELACRLRPDSILILPPYNRPRQINEMMEQVADAGVVCKFRTIPSLAELASGHLTASSIRSVDIEDLLERGQVEFDRADVRRFLKGKTVMITGAGGSIGSELARQVAGYEPGKLVLFEQSEFGLYSVEQELERLRPNLELIPVAGDIRREDSVRRAFDLAGKIDVIYHAAAYKHVPLMEKNVPACFQANVLGTACLAQEAVRTGVDRFVMISSDKAVRPTSIMGATKRLAERVINERDSGSTSFVSVRFGNVLGSSGSVVPLFKKQIETGGPVTVTSENMRRFFMTIPEAVDLVLQAGTVGRHREIMVLEMGEEIKIINLAKRLIELSGLTPGKDIQIEVTGLRPGEKEFEEVITEDENVVKTAYDKIWVMTKDADRGALPPLDLDEMRELVRCNNERALRQLAARCIPENCFEEII
jgi:FlaA1/EpsC-like NDP-sugar epimerase